MSDKIPAGYYLARAIAGSEQFGVTSKGTDQLVLDVDVPSLGRKLSVVLYFSDAAAPYALEKLRACGWTGDDVTDLRGIDANEIQLQVKYEMFDGSERMKTDIATGGGGRIVLDTPMDAAAKRGFAARMKTAAKGVPATKAQAARPAPSGGSSSLVDPESPDDDDPILF